MRQAVQEVRGAIQRIDNPATGRIFAFDHAGFLAEEAIAGTGFHQPVANGFFGATISAADKVAGAFHRSLQIFDFAEILDQRASSRARNFDHNVQISAADSHHALQSNKSLGVRPVL
ncbi:hypothetical protein KVU_1752 [Ketogulonicigenium vulgare WSH-001]|uniref:Uncharacterized protein n=1 Tax=Ketogulonicigenium vulgare (strain WSH-001) TaxID=759362 RepID=F9Y3H1_KETVW|nr:hypothetical protein KVU_1752 [Ketogulonicigenium vulgare WSH-001]